VRTITQVAKPATDSTVTDETSKLGGQSPDSAAQLGTVGGP
jgi:hypothetical protein